MANELTQEELDYLVDFVEGENHDWNKAKDDLKSDMHIDSIRKSFNVGKYCGYSVYKFMQQKMENDFLTDEEYVRLENLRDKEYKERVKLQDANREKRKVLRDFSRIEVLQEYIEQKLDEREPRDFKMCEYKISKGNEASILVSDLHCGAKVDNIFNYYDVEVMRERLKELATKTIKFAKRDNISHLNVEILGDVITGIIHGSTIAQSQEDIIDQIFDGTETLIDFVKLLRENIPNVKVFVVYGNHGRGHSNKTDGANSENYERLIAPYMRKEFRNTDIKVIDGGYEDFILYQLKDGRNIVITHGTNDSPNNANRDFTKLLGKDIFEVHMGHLHDVKETNGTVVNGTVMGGDDYSISKRFQPKSEQVMKVYYTDGDTATYKLTLN